jgi:hypothetical protein
LDAPQDSSTELLEGGAPSLCSVQIAYESVAYARLPLQNRHNKRVRGQNIHNKGVMARMFGSEPDSVAFF